MEEPIVPKSKVRWLLGITYVFMASAFFLVFVYCFFSYTYYRTDYINQQKQEIQDIQKNTVAKVEGLKSLSKDTAHVITTFQGDVGQIKGALAELQKSQKSPAIKTASYVKLSESRGVITPHETLPLKPEQLNYAKTFNDGSPVRIEGPYLVVESLEGNFAGIVELKVDLQEFRNLIGIGKSTSFIAPQGQTERIVENGLFPLYLKEPLGFIEYIEKQGPPFIMISEYIAIFAILFIEVFYYLKREFNKLFGGRLNYLSELCATRAKEIEGLSKLNSKLEQDKKRIRTTTEAQIDYFNNYILRQKELGHIIYDVQKGLLESYANPEDQLSKHEKVDLINSIQNYTQNLKENQCDKYKAKDVNLFNILEKAKLPFQEIAHKRNVTLNLKYPQDLNFSGDGFFTEFILHNLIGLSILNSQRNDEVTISSEKEDTFIQLEVRAKKNEVSSNHKDSMQNALGLIKDISALKKICVTNGVKFQTVKNKKGIWITKLLFPIDGEKRLHGNVIKLFG